jgi:CBS domain-containing protein
MKVGTLCVRQTVMVKRSDSLEEAAKLMRDYHVGTLIVVDAFEERNRPLGILTDRDIAVRAAAEGMSMQSPVSELTGNELVTAAEEELLYDVLDRMKSKGIRRIPVVDSEEYLVGILSMDDIIEFLTDEMKEITALFYRETKEERKR